MRWYYFVDSFYIEDSCLLLTMQEEVVNTDILDNVPQKTKWKKCPYMSRNMHCLAGGFANLDCYDVKFHDICHHKKKADNKGKNSEN